MDFEVLIPDGYEIVETDTVVASDETLVYTHFFKTAAKQHAKQLNQDRLGPLLRWEAEPTSKAMREQLGRVTRYVVVPYQNVLRKIEER